MTDGVDLWWIPLGAGAGGALVRTSGRIYEAVAAAAARRPRCALFHSALEVHLDGRTAAVEMTPVWTHQGERGVVVEGPVGAPLLGRSHLFRYEVRCWWGGTIPDRAAPVGTHRVTDDPEVARRLVALVPEFPPLTWGRDEQRTGDTSFQEHVEREPRAEPMLPDDLEAEPLVPLRRCAPVRDAHDRHHLLSHPGSLPHGTCRPHQIRWNRAGAVSRRSAADRHRSPRRSALSIAAASTAGSPAVLASAS
ncbi:MAG: hypothetical protein ACO1PW_00345 [Actinomycetota bacterium]